jgi:hypothetical protein
MTKLRLLNRMLACIFLLILFQMARAQNKTITGVVTDDKGAPLAGATVTVKGTVDAVNTDAAGKFTLSLRRLQRPNWSFPLWDMNRRRWR